MIPTKRIGIATLALSLFAAPAPTLSQSDVSVLVIPGDLKCGYADSDGIRYCGGIGHARNVCTGQNGEESPYPITIAVRDGTTIVGLLRAPGDIADPQDFGYVGVALRDGSADIRYKPLCGQ